ncbi:MAG: phosphomannomutase [gamma proteobacterium symbiont of Taylorina sp.]|nr:phosphomannomutase [gamma proteobacterium symbiont of Taylorina sp.]
MKTTIKDLMLSSQVTFGTSGARGLVKDMTDQVCYAYTLGFIQYLKDTQQLNNSSCIVLAGDLRDSTPAILNACARAILDSGIRPVNAGLVPTPAVALYGLDYQCPAIMVTGSHIPDDRNGIKFYKLAGEILKADEIIIKAQKIDLPDELFNSSGQFATVTQKSLSQDNALPEIDPTAEENYKKRYLDLFPDNALSGKKVGVYQHSGVARKIIPELLEKLGAEVILLGFSNSFIPVDTEAVRQEDIDLARQWTAEYNLDAIVSTDGDADRPLISDEKGEWFRGDIVGILCAQYLHIDHIVTPVSSNTCVEKSGLFADVKRSRIGSPYVIEVMNHYIEDHYASIAGYEANGGFLLASPIQNPRCDKDCLLTPLPTRDAVVVLLTLLHSAAEKNIPLSKLSAQLPQRYTFSNRIKNFAAEKSQQLMARYTHGREDENKQAIEADFPQLLQQLGQVININTIDGVRITFANEAIIHFRPSGNAPEFRCYSESDSEENAVEINQLAMQAVISQ